jgi:photosystem II stability/assembly factor-like uncharacterized protein
MCARSEQPELRDQAIARLLVEALKPEPSSSHDCPDAELLAAYADQVLLGDLERAQLETHFADCDRCQKILAALGVGLEAPAGESIASMPVPAAGPVAPRPAAQPAPSQPFSPQRWLWWLTPAFGAAAAALLWMVLRPAAPGPVQTAADYSRAAAGQETSALNAPASPQAAAQGPPEAAARRDAQDLDRLSKAEPAAKEAEAKTREQVLGRLAAPPADSVPATAPAVAAFQSEVTTAAAPQAAVAQAMIAPAPATEQAAPPAAPPARNRTAAANGQASLQARTEAASVAMLPQQTAPESLAGAQTAEAGIILYTFGPPSGSVTWRLGTAGLIERSTDQGRTWQRQSSGVTEDLIAGSSSSNEVAWVVGRGGVILRTTDGQRWERIAPPPGVTSEWAAVAAHDAMVATVVAGDLRRFSTSDGGRTWTLQP